MGIQLYQVNLVTGNVPLGTFATVEAALLAGLEILNAAIDADPDSDHEPDLRATIEGVEYLLVTNIDGSGYFCTPDEL